MKAIAIFLILNILLLSSFTGTAGTHHGKASCCMSTAQKDCCKQQKHNSDNDCAKSNCNAMLPCGTCGFVIAEVVSISPIVSFLNSQPIHSFAIGELSDYHGNGWNPPKV